MCHARKHHGFGFQRPRGFGRLGNRDEWVERLERHQRDLEQELADVSDLLKRLREKREPEPQTV